jgi:hypothetical protein
MTTTTKHETIVVIGDYQVPYHDPRAHAVAMEYLSDLRPDMIVNIGDHLDFEGVSSFTHKQESTEKFLADVETGKELLNDLRSTTNRLVLVEGNHEARLFKSVQKRMPELEAVVPSVAALLDIDEEDYIGPYGSAFEYKGLTFKHGDLHSKYASARELELEGSSGFSGHMHRFSAHMKTDRSGEHGWWVTGCMCYTEGEQAPPAARRGVNMMQNWQQGLTVIEIAEFSRTKRRFQPYQILIKNGKMIAPVRSQLYEA